MEGKERSVREVNLAEVKVKVTNVHMEGVSRTKNDLVESRLRTLFKATNFREMFEHASEVKSTLEDANVLSVKEIVIDTGEGKDDYEVIFNVKEPQRVTGGVATHIGTNEGSMEFNIALPNMLGRGERLSMAYTCGSTNSAEHHLLFVKPIGAALTSRFRCSLYQETASLPWSGYGEANRGVFAELASSTGTVDHSLRWEGVWRHLVPDFNAASFPVKEQAGHSIKSSIKHIMTRDTREDSVLPTSGTLLQVVQELAGLGGDAEFFKHEADFQWNLSLPLGSVFQASLGAGCLWQTEEAKNKKPVGIADKFFLGGPLTLRGFNFKGVGPNYKGNSLGSDSYWQGGLHLYTPLPFKPGKGGFGDLFRSHFFLNLGNSFNHSSIKGLKPKELIAAQRSDLRLTYGMGVVLRLGAVARVELNYCWPKYYVKGDSLREGFQFGIGMNFL